MTNRQIDYEDFLRKKSKLRRAPGLMLICRILTKTLNRLIASRFSGR